MRRPKNLAEVRGLGLRGVGTMKISISFVLAKQPS